MQPWLGATCASALSPTPRCCCRSPAFPGFLYPLQWKMFSILLTILSCLRLIEFCFHFLGARDGPLNPDTVKEPQSVFFFPPLASFSLEPESIHQHCRFCFSPPRRPPSSSTTKPSVPMSVSGAACSDQKYQKANRTR